MDSQQNKAAARSGFAAYYRGAAGNAAVEFALIVPLLVLLAIGCFDFSMGIYRKMQVDDAAQVGAQYAVVHGYDSAKISNVVVNATSFAGISASPAPTQFCGCPSAAGLTVVACNSICSNGLTSGAYVTVSSSGTYNTILSYPMIPSSFTLTGQGTVRLQ
jgi:Flp pilus assembly protein TadG